MEWEDEYGKYKNVGNVRIILSRTQKYIDENPVQDNYEQLSTEERLVMLEALQNQALLGGGL